MRFSTLTALLIALISAWTTGAARAAPASASVVIGSSLAPLYGPWRFHTGDDARWARPEFDDASWEQMNLKPKPGAHDDDVGLTGFVPGWNARGHKGYWGYAWYRMRVTVTAPPGTKLALTGPPMLDSVYQIYVDGRLMGQSGRFDGPKPVMLSVHPTIFPVGPGPAGDSSHVIALRVWMGRDGATSPEAGGIHIVPQIGEAEAADRLHQVQWLQTFKGYVVDASVGLAMLIVAAAALAVWPFDPKDRGYLWMALALAASGIGRGNQAVFFWSHLETIDGYVILRIILLGPLTLGAWVMTWKAWFDVERPRWIAPAAVAMTLALVVCQLTSWFAPPTVELAKGAIFWIRLGFVGLMALVLAKGVTTSGVRDRWLSLATALVMAVALFPDELSLLHVKGIWFPFGVGVSRTEYAQAAAVVLLCAVLVRRMLGYARELRQRAAVEASRLIDAETVEA